MLINGARPRVLNVFDVFGGAGGGTDATHNLARALMLAVLTQRADIRPFLAKLKEAA
jgi:hypothetical protein